MRDFTRYTYKKLLQTLQENGYQFQTFSEFLTKPLDKCVVLRHDSDIWPINDLKMAEMEFALKAKASYYFRVPETFNPEIIKKIVSMNHEVGYHYEDLVRHNGNIERSISSFSNNLSLLRTHAEVKTISRHGRPLSNIDSLDLWSSMDYKKEFDLIGEVYLDVDYTDILYLTDNGSKWNAHSSNIRDTVQKSEHSLNVRSTFELINAIKSNKTPHRVILNCHPARWNNNYFIWLYRFVLQKMKNIAKFLLKKFRN